jgi:hypothetical protein
MMRNEIDMKDNVEAFLVDVGGQTHNPFDH